MGPVRCTPHLSGAGAHAGAAAVVALAIASARSAPQGAKPGGRFGQLVFRRRLTIGEVRAASAGLLGLSRAQGSALVAVTDDGLSLTARARYEAVASLVSRRPLSAHYRQLRRPLHRCASQYRSLAFAEGIAYLRIDEHHRRPALRTGLGIEFTPAKPVQLPHKLKSLPSDKGMKALGVMPRGHRLAGALLAISERSGANRISPTQAPIVGGQEPRLSMRRHRWLRRRRSGLPAGWRPAC